VDKKAHRDKKLVHISDILASALGKYRPAMDIQMTRIWEIWDNAVGKPIAMNAKPDAFNDGILVVAVSSSSWMHQLRFLEKQMIANLNTQLGQPMIQQLRFKIGKILS